MSINIEELKDFFVLKGKHPLTFETIVEELKIQPKEHKKLTNALKALCAQDEIERRQPKGKKFFLYRLKNNKSVFNKKRTYVGYLKNHDSVLGVYNAGTKFFQLLGSKHQGVELKADKDNIDYHNIQNGAVVLIEPVKNKNKQVTRGEVIKVLAPQIKGNESLITEFTKQIPKTWTEGVLKEIKSFEEPSLKDLKGGKDFTDLPFVTIDGESSRDFDDAVYAEKWFDAKGNHQGWRVLVAIADVSYYVRPGSLLDAEAQKRGCSVYLPDKVIPMLPEKLSNGLCSLNPNKTRLALVTEVFLDLTGEPQKHKFYNGVIRSQHRLTYTQVQQVLDGDFSGYINENMYNQIINPLEQVYLLRRIKRQERGSLEVDIPEIYFDFKKNNESAGKLIFELKYTTSANQLIEELMVLNNIVVGQSLSTLKGLFRIHEAPGEEKMTDMVKNLESLGYELPPGFDVDAPSPMGFQNLINSMESLENKDFLLNMLLRAQSKAIYSFENIGHFGLGLEKYAHFTSPIRRYPDLVCHRLIKFMYNMGRGSYEYDDSTLTEIGASNTESEKLADKAEKECTKRKLAGHYQQDIGKTFEVYVDSISEKFVNVKMLESNVVGKLDLDDLKTLGYEVDVETNTINASFGKLKPILCGTKLNAKLVISDNITNTIIFSFESFVTKLSEVA